MICPKCGFEQDDGRAECVRCMVVFSKFEALLKRKEQSNARYSPQPGEESEESPDAGGEPNGSVQAALSPETVADLQRRVRRIQDSLDGMNRFQESLLQEMDRQKGRIRDLFNLFTGLRDAVDHQVLQIQGGLQPVVQAFRTVEAAITDGVELRALREEIRNLSERMDDLAPLRQAAVEAERLFPKLDQLEAVHRELRGMMTGRVDVPGDSPGSDLVMMRMELQALRSEVRTLMDQSLGGKQPPKAPGEHSRAELDKRLAELVRRLDALGKTREEEAARRDEFARGFENRLKEVEETVLSLSDGGSSSREFQDRMTALSAEMVSTRQALRAVQENSAARHDDILEIRAQLDSTRDLLDRIRSAWDHSSPAR
ncbi:MAG: hypothetical protein KA419_05115 [Acidobacteria bacterium]|nr:hypothetical protein [Acidobacteriota bacterium]